MFLGLDLECTLWICLYVVDVTLSKLIVLYSRYRVNQGTNLFVVCVLYNIFCFCFHCTFGPPVLGVPNL